MTTPKGSSGPSVLREEDPSWSLTGLSLRSDLVGLPRHVRDKPLPALRAPATPRPRPKAPERPTRPPQPHLPQVPSLAVLHGQQGQVVGSQALHALGDVPGGHHVGVVQPGGREPVREGGLQAPRALESEQRGGETRGSPLAQGPGSVPVGTVAPALGAPCRAPFSSECPWPVLPVSPHCSEAEKAGGLQISHHWAGMVCVVWCGVCVLRVCCV